MFSLVHAVFIFLFFYSLSSSTLTSFLVTRPLTLSNPSPLDLANVSVQLVFSSSDLIVQSKMRSDCLDLLFIPSTATSNSSRLDYWIESGCGNHQTTVWILVPLIPASSTLELKMVYGSPSSWIPDDHSSGLLSFSGRILTPSLSGSTDSSSTCPYTPLWTESFETATNEDRLLGYSTPSGSFGSIGGNIDHIHFETIPAERLRYHSGVTFDPSAPGLSSVSGSVSVACSEHNHTGFWLVCWATSNLNPLVNSDAILRTRLCEMDSLRPWGLVKGLLVLVDDAQIYSDLISSSSQFFESAKIGNRYLLLKSGSFNNGDNTETETIPSSIIHPHSTLAIPKTATSTDLLAGSESVRMLNHEHRELGSSCGVSDELNQEPPCRWLGGVRVKEEYEDLGISIPVGAVMIATELPPLGWEWVGLGWQEETLLRVTSDISKIQNSIECGSRHHTHNMTLPSIGQSQTAVMGSALAQSGSDMFGASADHYHTLEGDESQGDVVTETNDQHIPELVRLKLIRKLNSSSSIVNIALGKEILSYWECFALPFNDDRVCNAVGNCIDVDYCVCGQGVFGSKCEERIGEVGEITNLGNLTQVRIDYVVSITILEEIIVQEEGSGDVLANGRDQLGINCLRLGLEIPGNVTLTSCYFHLLGVWTDVLHIEYDLDLTQPTPSSLLLQPLTSLSTTPRLNITLQFHLPPTEPSPETTLVSFIASLVSASVVLVCLLLTLLFLLLFFFIRLRYQRKEQKLRQLKDIDIVLKEQSLRRGGGRDHKSSSSFDVFHRFNINTDLFVVEYSDIELKREIGSGGGSGGCIYEAMWLGRKVAFKRFEIRGTASSFDSNSNIDVTTGSFIEEFCREVSILASTHHPLLCECFGATIRLPRIGFLLEYCPNGDLEIFLKARIDYGMAERKRMVLEIASGMNYLHSLNILHRDLKSRNILVSEAEEIRVTDFGLSRVLQSQHSSEQLTLRIGTTGYMAPEIVSGTQYDSSVDVFSFGIIIYEILTNDFRWYGDEMNPQYRVVNDQTFRPRVSDPDLFDSIGPDLHILMQRCWSALPQNRPSFKEIVERGLGGRELKSSSLRVSSSIDMASYDGVGQRERQQHLFSSSSDSVVKGSIRERNERFEELRSRIVSRVEQEEEGEDGDGGEELLTLLGVLEKAVELGRVGGTSDEWKKLLD